MRTAEYNIITETPGSKATQEQVERLYQRYCFARKFAGAKNILEVACGSGIGLGFLSEVAKSVKGGDIDPENVALANRYCCRDAEKPEDRGKGCGIDVTIMDAHNILLPDSSIDLIVFFEAIYYLEKPEKFIAEAGRILREDGALMICTVNREWEEFHPSPFSVKYFSVSELYDLLKEEFKSIEMYAAFPVDAKGIKNKILSTLKKVALKFDLIPGSLKARAYLKRLFVGKLVSLPEEIYEGMASYEEPVRVAPDSSTKDFKIIYAVVKK